MPKRNTGTRKSKRKSIGLVEAVNRFSDDFAAEAWLVEKRWSGNITCPQCGRGNPEERKRRGKLRQWRCRDRKDCGKLFTVKTDTIMHDSKLPVSKWCIAYFLYSTNFKGVSSMKLHNDLEITQKSAWHLAHRIRLAFESSGDEFLGPVEVDEIYVGGRERNKHESKKLKQGRGIAGKIPVVGMKDRESGKISAKVVSDTKKPTLQSFVKERTDKDAVVFTDEHPSYTGLPRPHMAVRHSAKEFVNGMAHINGIESFWANLKRGYVGVYHNFSVKHLPRYVAEFEGRYNVRPMDTEDRMASIWDGGIDKRLTYAELIGEPETRQPAML